MAINRILSVRGTKLLAVVVTAVTVLGACRTKVERLDVDEVKDVSGRWNDTDSRLVSDEMIQDALSRPWVGDFSKRKGRKPEVIVGNVVNKTHEHLNTITFVKDLERALINSGRVGLVANRNERTQLRNERQDQAIHSEPSTKKPSGQEIGADFMLIGGVDSIVDQEKSRAVVYYQVELEAVDMTTNQKVWIGQKKVKKYVTRTETKF